MDACIRYVPSNEIPHGRGTDDDDDDEEESNDVSSAASSQHDDESENLLQEVEENSDLSSDTSNDVMECEPVSILRHIFFWIHVVVTFYFQTFEILI